MKNGFLRMCSIVLVLVLLVNMLPMSIFAEEYRESLTATPEVSTEAIDTSDAQIVEEIIDKRTEFSKEFLLSNGLHMAAVYPEAVHYETDTGWSEIDNTLVAKADGTYGNTAGVWNVSLPQQLSGAKSVVIEKDGYALSFAMAGELRGSGDVAAVSSVTEEPTVTAEILETTAETVAETIAETVPETTEAVVEETVPETTAAVVEETVPEATTEVIEETVPETTAAVVEETLTRVAESLALSQMQLSTAKIQPIDTAALREAYQYAEMAPVKLRSRLTYADVYRNTDIIYDLGSNTVKESIVMDAYSSTLRGYRYTLNVGDMIPVLEESGQITLYAPDRKTVVMVMPAPYLVDDADAYNSDIQVQLTGSGSSYTLSYILPQQWLAAEDRAWPVILDPVVNADLDSANIRDRTVASNKTYAQDSGTLSVGYGDVAGIMRSFLKYRNLPELTSSDVVIHANVQMLKGFVNDTTTTVEVHKVGGTWESETITWANQPAFIETVEDYVVAGTEVSWYSWEITDIVRDWYASENTGMMFKASNAVETGGTPSFKQFISSDYTDNDAYKPCLSIVFRNNNGLESYWNYTASSAGRAGTGYINNFTGNLVWVRDDLGFDGNRMPVSIQHIYNANDAANNAFGMGNGWRTNYNQRVYRWDNENADTEYYVWEDGDGTSHYFRLDGNCYKDEDGLELTLYTNGHGNSKYYIKDKNDNYSYFDTSGRLTKLENYQQTKSSIDIAYNSSGKIATVTDGAGRVYSFTYNSGDLLSRISYKGLGSTELIYVTFAYSGSKLTAVTDKDSKTSSYAYSGNLLTSAQDIDGYKLSYTYHPITDALWQPYRVKTVSETDGTAQGGALTIEYAHNQTTFTDHNGNVEIHQFNNFGNTVSIQDDEGHAQYTQYARNTDDEGTKTNQLTLSSKLQNTVGNVLKDSSFENGTNWVGNNANITVSRTTEQAYIGNYSLKLVNAADYTYAGYAPRFSVAAGETYTFSAYVKTVDATAQIALHSPTVPFEIRGTALPANQDWTRLEMSYTNTTGQTIGLCVCLFLTTSGTAYLDCVQAEKAQTASRYNLIENGDFRYGEYGWTRGGSFASTETYTTASSAAPELDGTVYKIVGNPSVAKHLWQRVQVSGNAGDTYVLSGWAKGNSVPLNNYDSTSPREFCLVGFIYYTDGSIEEYRVPFNPDTDSVEKWQYAAGVFVTKKPYSSIGLDIRYDYNANTAYFDGIQLYKEEFGTSYTYDADGNVKSVTDLQKQTTTYEYSNNNLTKVIQNGKAKMTYTYDSYHNVKTATTEEGLVYNFAYDAYGNNTAVSITDNGVTMTSTAAYSSDGNRLVSTTDALGKVTTYHYNADTNVLEWVQYPEDTEDTRTEYTYDNMYRIASAACETDTGLNLSATYTYADDYLTGIQTPSTTYSFSYGDFGLRQRVGIGERTLAEYSYTNDANRYLSALDYGNGDRVQYTYDDKGRLLTETYEDGDTVTYTYDNNGSLAKVTDSATGITTTYYYDLTDRMVKYTESGTDYFHSVSYEYDVENNLAQQVEIINGTEHITSYTYDDDNRVASVTTDGTTVGYTYDDFGRVSQQVTKNGDATVLTESYTYVDPGDGKTSAQVATYTTSASGYDVTYTYAYDDNGNILSITDNTSITTYQYDSANQLLRENNSGYWYTKTWSYDNSGNLLSNATYNYTNNEPESPRITFTYTYGDSEWGDLLTGYGVKTIASDEIGNMTSDGIWTYNWEHGRQLANMTRSSKTFWNFTYDANGMRTGRTNGTAMGTYSYVYSGDKLIQMKNNNTVVDFSYDADGTPLTMTYDGTVYYYTTNLQGDVVGLRNSDGSVTANYVYDAWGNVVRQSGNSALLLLNPLLYRGYVYDRETKLYYLQSRYYNPELGRFISADAFTSTGQGFIGNNMFAYCGNNPVRYADSSGHVPDDVLLKNAQLYASGANILMCGYQNNSHNAAKAIYSTHTRKNVVIYDNGVTPSDVVVNNTKNVIVYDKRDSNLDENGNHNPDIQILNSYLITDRVDQVGVFAILILYNYSNPSEYEWRRTQTSFLIEWDMHNFFAFADQSAKDVDFDNKEEGAGYLYFCGKAAYKFGKKIIKPFLP